MIPPRYLCNKHLVAEHGEIHKFRHNFVKRHSIKGRIFPTVQIEPASMKLRHDELVLEMEKRSMNHHSPYELPDISYLPPDQRYAKVDIDISFRDLGYRCCACRERMTAPEQKELFA
jgi:hypothetical protein